MCRSLGHNAHYDGYDIALTRVICESVRVPVMAPGGCGRARRMLDVFDRANVNAAIAASIFHYEKSTVDR